jgi:hypothetical protein
VVARTWRILDYSSLTTCDCSNHYINLYTHLARVPTIVTVSQHFPTGALQHQRYLTTQSFRAVSQHLSHHILARHKSSDAPPTTTRALLTVSYILSNCNNDRNMSHTIPQLLSIFSRTIGIGRKTVGFLLRGRERKTIHRERNNPQQAACAEPRCLLYNVVYQLMMENAREGRGCEAFCTWRALGRGAS